MIYNLSFLLSFSEITPTTTEPTTTTSAPKLLIQLDCPHNDMELYTTRHTGKKAGSWQECAERCRSGHESDVWSCFEWTVQSLEANTCAFQLIVKYIAWNSPGIVTNESWISCIKLVLTHIWFERKGHQICGWCTQQWRQHQTLLTCLRRQESSCNYWFWHSPQSESIHWRSWCGTMTKAVFSNRIIKGAFSGAKDCKGNLCFSQLCCM